MNLDWQITKKQKLFIESTADEVLFGGAAGGGKSYAQLIDAFLYAIKYPKSKQIIFRRTFPELEKSLIRVHLGLYPREIYKYNSSNHTGKFKNGSVIDFGYCDTKNDVYKYQSAEYDVIRFDELTHFEEDMYVYLLSRLRGANNFPKQIKSSTNPGGIGHYWVKGRFIDFTPPFKEKTADNGTSRVFIPAKVQENKMLMQADPNYIKRLQALDEKDKKALLYGDWDIFDGQYFTEFKRDIHVIKPFNVPKYWKKYITMDYGLDMLAAYKIAVDTNGKAYVLSEVYEPNLIISKAAEKVKTLIQDDDISVFYAPPDLYNRRQDTGKSVAEIFAEHGVFLSKSDNNRVQGWYNLKEWLQPYTDEFEKVTAKLLIFENCRNLIRTLPALVYDKHNPNDVSDTPHELTHAPDAIRYFVAGRPQKAYIASEDTDILSYNTQIDNFISY